MVMATAFLNRTWCNIAYFFWKFIYDFLLIIYWECHCTVERDRPVYSKNILFAESHFQFFHKFLQEFTIIPSLSFSGYCFRYFGFQFCSASFVYAWNHSCCMLKVFSNFCLTSTPIDLQCCHTSIMFCEQVTLGIASCSCSYSFLTLQEKCTFSMFKNLWFYASLILTLSVFFFLLADILNLG